MKISAFISASVSASASARAVRVISAGGMSSAVRVGNPSRREQEVRVEVFWRRPLVPKEVLVRVVRGLCSIRAEE